MVKESNQYSEISTLDYATMLAKIAVGEPVMDFQPRDASIFNDCYPTVGELSVVVSNLFHTVKQLQIEIKSLKLNAQAR